MITCMSRDKAKKGAEATPEGRTMLLIDDRDSIREAWERMGGVFVHHRSARESIEKLRVLGLE